ncbi:hypothetical protein Tco_0474842 [Tanacetum coccineum]
MADSTHSQCKNKSFDKVQKAFDNTWVWLKAVVNKKEFKKKQKIDDDQEEAEMKKHMEIVVDEEEIAVDAIPLATKPPIIVDWKIIKEGKNWYFQIIRADGSSRRKYKARGKEASLERVFLRNLHIFMVGREKKLFHFTPATITAMLNKKLQADHWNKMCYQLLKLRRHDDLGVNIAKVRVTTAISAAGIKVNAAGYNW